MGEEGLLTTHRSIHTDTLSLCVNTQTYWCVCAGTGLLILVYLISLVPSVFSEERSRQFHWTWTWPISTSPVSGCTDETELIVTSGFGPFQLLFTSDELISLTLSQTDVRQ